MLTFKFIGFQRNLNYDVLAFPLIILLLYHTRKGKSTMDSCLCYCRFKK